MGRVSSGILNTLHSFASDLADGEARLMKNYVSLWRPAPGEKRADGAEASFQEAAVRHAEEYIDVTHRYYQELFKLSHSIADKALSSVSSAVTSAEKASPAVEKDPSAAS